MRTTGRCGIHAAVLLGFVAWAAPAAGEEAPTAQGGLDAMRSCTRCHDESERVPVLSILKSKHAIMADPRTPFADEACITCHGPSTAHMQAPAQEGARRVRPDFVFPHGTAVEATEANERCLGCHEGGGRMHWKGSVHEFQGLACSSCHKIHAGNDPVLTRAAQPEVCFDCHREKRAEVHRPYSHPVREGEMACGDCHNPHGSTGPNLLLASTTNETCYACHAEKRGPFLWEHAPVREDCSNCHRPHGSVHASLLKTRMPWLCQQCHMAQFHPSTAYSGTGLPGDFVPSGAQQLLGKSCLNCHSQVHGSNHPSGVRKTR